MSDADTVAKARKGLEPTTGRRWAVVLNVTVGGGALHVLAPGAA